MSSERTLAARLLATFVSELEEQVQSMNADLLALESDPAGAERLRSLFRSAHTLKGAARAAGVPLVEEVFHGVEALLDRARRGALTLGKDDFALLFRTVDALADAGARIRSGEGLEGSPLAGLRGSFRAPRAAEARTPPAPPPGAGPRAPSPRAEPAAEATEMGGIVRVEADKLDALVSSSGEMRTASRRLQGRPPELRELSDSFSGARREWQRALERIHQALEPDSPALREVEGMEAGLRRLAQEISRLADASEKDARAVERLSDELSGDVRRLRMRPFADACDGLPRLVRDLATTAGKEVRLELGGEDVEADREVWTALREALLHLVRNAVDHGIEPPDARAAAGKPRGGTVSVSARAHGGRIAVTVADDGAGLDLAAVRERMHERGLAAPERDGDLARLLFSAGISTRDGATLVSGRGVGLDAVRAAVERIRGSIDVAWSEGKGTTFTVTCPPSLTSVRALLVSVGSQLFAVPTADVEHLVRATPDSIRSVDGREVLRTAEGPLPIVGLDRLLGPPLVRDPRPGAAPILSLRLGGRRMAVAVDEMLDERELLVRPLRRVRNPPAYLGGAAILSSGRIALVLNAAALLDAGLAASPAPGAPLFGGAADQPRRARILVVDDSITTRTLEASILEAAGFEVATASDGAAAWQTLQEWECDLVVSDVEMPRMDGFSLCEAIRSSKRLGALPVVLVTALETPADRARGLEAGADAYLAKSSFDQEQLLETIRQLVGEP